MSLDTRMAFERHQPSSDLRAFLDPLKPGEYFDCGEARLYGIDDALEAEAMRRGREVGDDEFQLVATDGGLIFCRASISFAIAARWRDLNIGRPEESSVAGFVLLPISWPTHGDLRFTVSRRLGSNVFRRWLQLQAQATRRHQVEHETRPEPGTGPARLRPAETAVLNGHVGPDRPIQRRQPAPGPANDVEIDLREGPAPAQTPSPPGSPQDPAPQGSAPQEPSYRPAPEAPSPVSTELPSSLRLDDADREAILYATAQVRRRRMRAVEAEPSDASQNPKPGVQEFAIPEPANRESAVPGPVVQEPDPQPTVDQDTAVNQPEVREPYGQPPAVQDAEDSDPDEYEIEPMPESAPADGDMEAPETAVRPASLDQDVAESWVDDRQPDSVPASDRSGRWIVEPTEGLEVVAAEPAVRLVDDEPGMDPVPLKQPVRFEARPAATNEPPLQGLSERADDEFARGVAAASVPAGVDEVEAEVLSSDSGPATTFMSETVDGTQIYPESAPSSHQPGGMPRRGLELQDREPPRNDELQQVGAPVPEISGARLQYPDTPAGAGAGSALDVRSALLTDQQESGLVETLRQRRAIILGLASVVALLVIVFIGMVVGDREDQTAAVAGDPQSADGSTSDGDESGTEPAASDQASDDQSASPDSTASTVSTADASTTGGVIDDETLSTADSTLRITSTTVQICHSNYGGCVPVAADVDCAGDGDGPAFQTEPVAVFGDDVYELDTDGDRQACEPDQPRATAADAG